jgi:formiminoglutamase
MNDFFVKYKKSDIDADVLRRVGETKLGEVLVVPAEESLPAFLESTTASFVVLGVAEDIGVLANYGKAGASDTWNLFLRSFLNIQANHFTKAESIAVIGYFSFDKIKEEIETNSGTYDEKILDYRNAVTMIDNAVVELIQLIVSHRKIPIVVGGGHNNSYPLIKATALALNSRKGIHCINLDAHLDYRATEGRHSGNGFRYAKKDGFLKRYFALAVHQNYLNDSIMDEIHRDRDVDLISYEDVFIREKKTWLKALKAAVKFVGKKVTGIELDLDSISNVPSSASTPCGITTREALQYVDYVATHCDVAYLHVCEGIASAENDVGKLVSYVVTQFVKSRSLKNPSRSRKSTTN